MQVVSSLGMVIYEALDFGLGEDEERELSEAINELISHMTGGAEEAEDEGCSKILCGTFGRDSEPFEWPTDSRTTSTIIRVRNEAVTD